LTILEALEKAARERLPMHMPGHKRRAEAEYLKKLACDIDVTEIDGFDDLNDPRGVILESERRAAELFGAERSFFLVGGSTVGILAGIYSLLSPGDGVLMARNCHKSVYNAVEICGAVPEYIVPEVDENGIFGGVDPEEVGRRLASGKNKLVVLTSPTYEGVISDVASIKRVCDRYGVILLVDAAHGAHLDLSGYFTGGAVRAGADIVVSSLHKTLPSLTQTAIAHTRERFAEAFGRAAAVFQTSSPSYLLLASADGCCGFVAEHPEYFKRWSDALDGFYEKAERFRNLGVFRGGNAFGHDKSKIVVTVGKTSLTGFGLAGILRREGIEPEMAADGYALAMTGPFDGEKELNALFAALSKADASAERSGDRRIVLPSLPEYRMTPKKALSLPFEEVAADEAVGRTAAEYVYAYPPGIPFTVPGEAVGADAVAAARDVISHGGRIISSSDGLKTVKVLK